MFPMLPEKLSTDLSSLNQDEDRLAVVIEYVVDGGRRPARSPTSTGRSSATRRSSPTTPWTPGGTGGARCPRPWRASPGVDAQIRLQETAAQKLRARRYEEGALDLETIEARAVFDGETITDLTVDPQNQPRQLIEDFMVAANGVTARFLEEKRFPSLRRVVRSPERWLRIVTVASGYGFTLPPEPDAKALEAFLKERRRADPLTVPGPLARDRQAHGRWRVRARDAGPDADRALRPRRA